MARALAVEEVNTRGEREQVRRMCKAFHAIEGLDLGVEQVTASASVAGGDLLRAWFDEALARDLSDLTREYLVQLRSRLVTRLQFREFIDLALDWFEKMRVDTTRIQDAFDEFESEVTAWRDVVRSIVERLGTEC